MAGTVTGFSFVAVSPAPVFELSRVNAQEIVLTGDVVNSMLSNVSEGRGVFSSSAGMPKAGGA